MLLESPLSPQRDRKYPCTDISTIVETKLLHFDISSSTCEALVRIQSLAYATTRAHEKWRPVILDAIKMSTEIFP